MSLSFRLNESFKRFEICIIFFFFFYPVISLVLGLINCCVQNLVSEVVLLLPLLLRLRHPGADATRVGPAVEERNWSGMENVQFCLFRKNIRLHQQKRRCVILPTAAAVMAEFL